MFSCADVFCDEESIKVSAHLQPAGIEHLVFTEFFYCDWIFFYRFIIYL